MPKITLQVPHTLGQAEATRRLKEKLNLAKGKVTDLHERWQDNTLTFDFQIMNMKVSGTITVEETVIAVALDLPFAMMMFKGMVEQRVSQELIEVVK
jgi:hypothetical protein